MLIDARRTRDKHTREMVEGSLVWCAPKTPLTPDPDNDNDGETVAVAAPDRTVSNATAPRSSLLRYAGIDKAMRMKGGQISLIYGYPLLPATQTSRG